MDPYSSLLSHFSNELQKLLDCKIQELEEEAMRCSLGRLFYLGCGFTEFLQNMFCYLSLEDLLVCRLVCREWKYFIDSIVWDHHPLIRNHSNWVQGVEKTLKLYCGGPVCCLASNERYIVCGLKTGILIIYDSSTYRFLNLVDPGPVRIWSLRLGSHCLAAVTESQLIVWSLKDFQLIVRVRHGGKFQPYLNIYENILVIPGETKYTSRVLLYNSEKNIIKGIRDLEHGRYWVLDACCHSLQVLTLSLFAYGTNTSRELKVWDILSGSCICTVSAKGGVGGQIQYKPPLAFLSTSYKAIDIWNMDTRQHLRNITINFFSFKIEHQFLYIMLDKQGNIKIMKINELRNMEKNLESLWNRSISSVSGEVDLSTAQGKFSVCCNQLTLISKHNSHYVTVIQVHK